MLGQGSGRQEGDNGKKGEIMSNKLNLTTWEPNKFDLRPSIGGSPDGQSEIKPIRLPCGQSQFVTHKGFSTSTPDGTKQLHSKQLGKKTEAKSRQRGPEKLLTSAIALASAFASAEAAW